MTIFLGGPGIPSSTVSVAPGLIVSHTYDSPLILTVPPPEPDDPDGPFPFAYRQTIRARGTVVAFS